MGSIYGAYVVTYKQDLILENLNSFIYFYLIFLPECFVTIATGIAQNPGLGLLLLGIVKICCDNATPKCYNQ